MLNADTTEVYALQVFALGVATQNRVFLGKIVNYFCDDELSQIARDMQNHYEKSWPSLSKWLNDLGCNITDSGKLVSDEVIRKMEADRGFSAICGNIHHLMDILDAKVNPSLMEKQAFIRGIKAMGR